MRTKLTNAKLRELESLCVKFIEDHDIGHPETIFQCDPVILDALEFIRSIADVVGYCEVRHGDV